MRFTACLLGLGLGLTATAPLDARAQYAPDPNTPAAPDAAAPASPDDATPPPAAQPAPAPAPRPGPYPTRPPEAYRRPPQTNPPAYVPAPPPGYVVRWTPQGYVYVPVSPQATAPGGRIPPPPSSPPQYAQPQPPPPPPYAPPAPYEGEPRRGFHRAPPIETQLRLTGGPQNDGKGYAAGVGLSIDTPAIGMNAAVDALSWDPVTGPSSADTHQPMAFGSAHVTFSAISTRELRLRLEVGGSMLSWPGPQAVGNQPWADKTIFGPDFGVSAVLRLSGPLSIEGYTRVMPTPVTVTDSKLGLTFRAGVLGVNAGWRYLRVHGDTGPDADAPDFRFRGPEVGLVLAF